MSQPAPALPGCRLLDLQPELLARVVSFLPTRRSTAAVMATCRLLRDIVLGHHPGVHVVLPACHAPHSDTLGGLRGISQGWAALRRALDTARDSTRGLVHLSMQGRELDGVPVTLFMCLPIDVAFTELRRVTLTRVALDSVVPAVLAASCPSMARLHIQDCSIGPPRLPTPAYPSLEYLEISSCRFLHPAWDRQGSEDDLAHLPGGSVVTGSPAAGATTVAETADPVVPMLPCPPLPRLKALVITGVSAGTTLLRRGVVRPQQLERFEWHCVALLPRRLTSSAGLWPLLQHLVVKSPVDDAMARFLVALPSLRTLALQWVDQITTSVAHHGWGVQRLTLRYAHVSPALLALLARLPPARAVELELAYLHVPPPALPAWQRLLASGVGMGRSRFVDLVGVSSGTCPEALAAVVPHIAGALDLSKCDVADSVWAAVLEAAHTRPLLIVVSRTQVLPPHVQQAVCMRMVSRDVERRRVRGAVLVLGPPLELLAAPPSTSGGPAAAAASAAHLESCIWQLVRVLWLVYRHDSGTEDAARHALHAYLATVASGGGSGGTSVGWPEDMVALRAVVRRHCLQGNAWHVAHMLHDLVGVRVWESGAAQPSPIMEEWHDGRPF